MDLTKILKPGDKVWTIQHGWVELESVSDNTFGEMYPLRTVDIPGRAFEDCMYTCEGEFKKGDKHPSLFLKEQIFDLSIPEPVFEQDELVWAKLKEDYWAPAYYDMDGGPREWHWVFEHQRPLKKSGAGRSYPAKEVRKWEDSPFKDQEQ